MSITAAAVHAALRSVGVVLGTVRASDYLRGLLNA
jgi:hypothetical protein